MTAATNNFPNPLERKRILICIDWFEPAYKAGGPIRSIKNMVELLKKEFDFYILTSDRDSGDDKAFDNVELNTWISKEDYSIYYLSKERQKYSNISALLKEKDFDKYYFNSFFSFKFTLLPLISLKSRNLDSKTILAPRGMMGEAALQIKAMKKKFFILMSKIVGLYRNITWHASTKLEKQEIVTQFGESAKVHIAQNVSQKPDHIQQIEKVDISRFVFLSRISPKKNLLKAIAFFDEMHFPNKKVEFHIYGPIEDKEYWKRCEEQIKKLKTNATIAYKGMLNRKELYSTLSGYHFMLFPTKNENFGHNIAEALICGLPVIISDQTPWRDLEKHKSGWDIPLMDREQFQKTIKAAVEMSDGEYQKWRSAARKFAEKKLFSDEVYESNRRLFE